MRFCDWCTSLLIQKDGETASKFRRRRCCNTSCAHKLSYWCRMQKRITDQRQSYVERKFIKGRQNNKQKALSAIVGRIKSRRA